MVAVLKGIPVFGFKTIKNCITLYSKNKKYQYIFMRQIIMTKTVNHIGNLLFSEITAEINLPTLFASTPSLKSLSLVSNIARRVALY